MSIYLLSKDNPASDGLAALSIEILDAFFSSFYLNTPKLTGCIYPETCDMCEEKEIDDFETPRTNAELAPMGK